MKTTRIIVKVESKKIDATAWAYGVFAVGAIMLLIGIVTVLVCGKATEGVAWLLAGAAPTSLAMYFAGKADALSNIKREIMDEIAMDSLEAAEGSDE